MADDDSGEAFLRLEVLPHTTDGGYIPDSAKIGHEISFIHCFCNPQPLGTREMIRADGLTQEKETEGQLGKIIGGRVK